MKDKNLTNIFQVEGKILQKNVSYFNDIRKDTFRMDVEVRDGKLCTFDFNMSGFKDIIEKLKTGDRVRVTGYMYYTKRWWAKRYVLIPHVEKIEIL